MVFYGEIRAFGAVYRATSFTQFSQPPPLLEKKKLFTTDKPSA